MTSEQMPAITPLDSRSTAPVGGIAAIAATLGPTHMATLTHAVSTVAQASASLGIGDIALDDILNLECVKLAALSEGEIGFTAEQALNQLRMNPGIVERIQALRNTEADRAVTDAKLASLSRSDRISYARQHGLTSAPKKSGGMSHAEALQVAAQLSPAARIGFWRDYKAGK